MAADWTRDDLTEGDLLVYCEQPSPFMPRSRWDWAYTPDAEVVPRHGLPDSHRLVEVMNGTLGIYVGKRTRKVLDPYTIPLVYVPALALCVPIVDDWRLA